MEGICYSTVFAFQSILTDGNQRLMFPLAYEWENFCFPFFALLNCLITTQYFPFYLAHSQMAGLFWNSFPKERGTQDNIFSTHFISISIPVMSNPGLFLKPKPFLHSIYIIVIENIPLSLQQKLFPGVHYMYNRVQEY